MATRWLKVGDKVEVTFGEVRWVRGVVRGTDVEGVVARISLEDDRTVYVRTDLRPCNASPDVKRIVRG